MKLKLTAARGKLIKVKEKAMNNISNNIIKSLNQI